MLLAVGLRMLPEGLEFVEPDALQPHPANPNQGDVGAIGDSIDSVGFYSTIYAQRSTGRILAGEHRWLALKERGATAVPVIYLDVDDEDALRILIADNEIPRRTSHADDARLSALLTDLAQQTGRGLVGTGFDGDRLDALIADVSRPLRLTKGPQDEERERCGECGRLKPADSGVGSPR